jgi:hypothetical protein
MLRVAWTAITVALELLAAAQVIKWIVRLLGWGEHIEFIANRIHDIGGAGVVIEALLDPPPPLGLTIVVAALLLMWWDLRKRPVPNVGSLNIGLPKITLDRKSLSAWGLLFLLIVGPVAIIKMFFPPKPMVVDTPRPQFYTGPQQSTWEKLLFACEIPPPTPTAEKDFPRQYAIAKSGFIAWGESLGLTTTVTEVTGGVRLEFEGATDEGRKRMRMIGGYGINKLTFEGRRVGQWEIISFTTHIQQLPGPVQLLYLFPPNPTSQSVTQIRQILERLFSIQENRCQMF